jgi:hypothetical protein
MVAQREREKEREREREREREGEREREKEREEQPPCIMMQKRLNVYMMMILTDSGGRIIGICKVEGAS